MPIIEEIDSGIDAASSSNSREDSPSAKKSDMANMIEDDDTNFISSITLANDCKMHKLSMLDVSFTKSSSLDMDETLGERLWGLTEMFPESLRNLTSAVVYGSLSGVKSLYSFTRSASWVFFTTTTILVAPVLFEVERTNLEEVQRQQQRQILLGPSAAVGGGVPNLGMPMPPQMAQR